MMESDLPPGSCNSTGHLSTIGHHTLPGRMHHSASTPAGVDGAGGGSRTPPATPKKGGKMLAVRVQMLDDTISMFQIQSKALGRVLFEQVCRQLHLLEADYFGLEYQDANGTKYWLDVEKPMCRQLGLSMLEPTLRFCVKFYTPDPARLEEEFTRYLFCLQVKRDLAYGSIQCNENTAALIASYIVQSECGDFVPEDYPDHTYLSGYKFFPGQDSESERRIMENHKKHIGQSPAEADLNLLETARRCELYGIKMHPAKDHEGTPLNLAVAHGGIIVFQNYTKINTFSWAKIRKISFKRKKFLIKLHSEGYGHYRDVVEFFFEGRNECKNFWKKCVENHGFFRCSSVPRLPRHKTRVISRGSSFRYSGKTQKQIVEFVRDNYVKRQTFQRSGSFRASRSLRSSRGNVSAHAPAPPLAPLNTSVSAHPLLPLPPGSDAISLEWDKQPHYLEASLMMKGYTSEEARQAALRTRRTSEGGGRPPLAATAFASTRDKLTKMYYNQIQVAPELVTRAEVNHHRTEASPLPHRTTTPLVSPESIWRPGSLPHASAHMRAPTPPPRHPLPAEMVAAPDEEGKPEPEVLRQSTEASKEIRVADDAGTLANGHDAADHANNNCDRVNGNIIVNVVTDSTSMDVLSGGESDTGDTLSRRNNNSVTSCMTGTLREGGPTDARRRADPAYYVAKELLMTERTYKRDLELVTVKWSSMVSELSTGADTLPDVVSALARPCLALEPLALAQGALLARLEWAFAMDQHHENDEPEYRKISELFHEHLSSTADVYMDYSQDASVLVGLVEYMRRKHASAARACSVFDAGSPLPLTALLVRPLHRLVYYTRLTNELMSLKTNGRASAAHALASRLAGSADEKLAHVEDHATLCQLQRDITGYDKLLMANREFIGLGCVYKHSSRGLQQRMLFLFSDILLISSKCENGQFRAHCVWPLHALELQPADLPHSFTITGENINVTISASNETEFVSWCRALEENIGRARDCTAAVDTELTPYQLDTSELSSGANGGVVGGGGLAHVCWHRATSLYRDHLYLAMNTQLSGYLLRKFKNSHGWQKLWVVFAVFTLFFYKSWHDETPLASLPLLGYSVEQPAPADAIHKEFVFKLQFKNHVYFFRADSHFTFKRWTEVLRTVMVHDLGRNGP